MKPIPNIFDKIKSSKNLPSLPQVLLKLVEACNCEKATPGELSRITSQDPSLSTKVMRLVNSAYLGLPQRVNSLEKAVVFLGADTIKNIAISASVLQAFSRTRAHAFLKLSHFWWHSFKCAALARRIAKEISYPLPEEAFLSGLLHDIGKLILSVNFAKTYSAILKEANHRPAPLLNQERLMGTTHAEVGAWLIRQWQLNSLMADAVLYHHEETQRVSDAFPIVKIVYVANALCQVHPEDLQTGLKVADALFGFSPAQVERIVSGADEEVIDVARSLDIKIEAPRIEDTPEPGEAVDRAESASLRFDDEENGPDGLLTEVKDISLLYGTLQNLLKAEDRYAILRAVARGLQILFEIQAVLFFLYDPEKDRLIGTPLPDDIGDEPIMGLEISCSGAKSLIAQSLSVNRILDSLGHLTGEAASLADEQIVRLLGADGILCLPMAAQGKQVGVIVMATDRHQCSHLSGQQKLLKMFAGHAAMCLHVDDVKRRQARIIKSARMEASSIIARKVVHEVNNPLGIIKNYIKILGLKLPERHPAQGELKIISEEIDRAAKILLQLSAFSEPSVNRPEPCDVNRLFADLLQIMRKSILQPAMIKTHLELDPALPQVTTEKNSLSQVFVNLVNNAAQAMSGGGNIHIKTEYVPASEKRFSAAAQAAAQGRAVITIRDDGPGIPESIQTRLFEPFNSSKGAGHSGLGLSIVHSLIKELNGTIACQSDRDKGTVFIIELPLSA